MMKNTFSSLYIATLAMVLFASCTSEDLFEGETNAKSAAVVVKSINCSFTQTRQGSESDDTYKRNWQMSDSVSIYNNKANSTLIPLGEGESTAFRPLNGDQICLSGMVSAFYPETLLTNGRGIFTLAGQNGTLENLDSFYLMTASTEVNGNENVSLSFSSEMSVLKINVNDILSNGESVEKIQLVGDGMCNKLNVDLMNGDIVLSPANESAISVNCADNESGDYYVVFFPTDNDVVVGFHTSCGQSYVATLSTQDFSTGKVTSLNAGQFEEGSTSSLNVNVDESTHSYTYEISI